MNLILGKKRKSATPFLPKKSISKAKYSNKGIFNKESFKNIKLPEVIEKTLADTVNYAISTNTKNTYATAINNLNACRTEHSEPMTLPLNERDILIFIGFCIGRGNQGNTIKSYLSGIKKYHVALGHKNFEYMSPLVKEVLEGQNKKVTKLKSMGQSEDRIPCTLNILKLIKHELKLSRLEPDEKIVVWATCTLSFFGALRSAEVLCKDQYEYDPLDTLLKGDIKVCPADKTGKESVSIKIRNSKTSKGHSELVSVYANYGPTCPVAATKKF